MSVSNGFADYVLEQLGGLGRVRAKRMFGGMGLYADEVFFALIDDDVLYLKTFDDTRSEFVAAGSRPFMPDPRKPDQTMGYYSVPPAVLEDADELVQWARKAVVRAQALPQKPARKKRAKSR